MTKQQWHMATTPLEDGWVEHSTRGSRWQRRMEPRQGLILLSACLAASPKWEAETCWVVLKEGRPWKQDFCDSWERPLRCSQHWLKQKRQNSVTPRTEYGSVRSQGKSLKSDRKVLISDKRPELSWRSSQPWNRRLSGHSGRVGEREIHSQTGAREPSLVSSRPLRPSSEWGIETLSKSLPAPDSLPNCRWFYQTLLEVAAGAM